MLVLINLEGAVERRQRMTAQLDAHGVEFERIGFDGRQLAPTAIAAWAAEHLPAVRFDFTRLSGAEVGCWISHLLAWRGLLSRPALPSCTVIEDDLILQPDFSEAIAILERQQIYDVVYLGTSSRNLSTRRSRTINGLRLHQPVGAVFNTWGYVIRRGFVERFFAMQRSIKLPIDHVLGGRVARLRPAIAVAQPALVEEDPVLGRDSQIEPFTFRIDRARIVESTRRRLLASRVGGLYFSLYRWL